MIVSGAGGWCRLAVLGCCLLASTQAPESLSGSEVLALARSAARTSSQPVVRGLLVKGVLRTSGSGEVGWRSLTFGLADRFTELREVRPNSRLGEYSALSRHDDLTVAVGERQLDLAPEARRRVLNRLATFRLIFLLELPPDCLLPGSDAQRDVGGDWTLTLSNRCGAGKLTFAGSPLRLRRIVTPIRVVPGEVVEHGGRSSEPPRDAEAERIASEYRPVKGLWIPFRVTQRMNAIEEVFVVEQVTVDPPGTGDGRQSARGQKTKAGGRR